MLYLFHVMYFYNCYFAHINSNENSFINYVFKNMFTGHDLSNLVRFESTRNKKSHRMRILLLLSIIIILLNCGTAWRTFLRGRSNNGNLGVPKLSKDYVLPTEQWFKQFLDHFNPTDARTWEQVNLKKN